MYEDSINKLIGVHQIVVAFAKDEETPQSRAFLLLADELAEVIKKLQAA